MGFDNVPVKHGHVAPFHFNAHDWPYSPQVQRHIIAQNGYPSAR